MSLLYLSIPALVFLTVLVLVIKWPVRDPRKRDLNRALKILRKAGFKADVVKFKQNR